MNNYLKKTVRLIDHFPKWIPEIRLLDLIEEIGELCNAILVNEGHKNIKRKKSGIEDSICDIFFNLFLLCHNYDIDIDEAYNTMIYKLEKRINKGDFNL